MAKQAKKNATGNSNPEAGSEKANEQIQSTPVTEEIKPGEVNEDNLESLVNALDNVNEQTKATEEIKAKDEAGASETGILELNGDDIQKLQDAGIIIYDDQKLVLNPEAVFVYDETLTLVDEEGAKMLAAANVIDVSQGIAKVNKEILKDLEEFIPMPEKGTEAKILTFIYGVNDNQVKVDGALSMQFEHFMSSQNAVVLACSDGTLLAGAFGLNSRWSFSAVKEGSAFRGIAAEGDIDDPNIPGKTDVVVFEKELEWIVATKRMECEIPMKEANADKAG